MSISFLKKSVSCSGVILCLMSSSFASNFDYAYDPLMGARPAAGLVKVRVWETNLPSRVGHVSLETDLSHISLWPNSNSSEAKDISKFVQSSSDSSVNFNPIIVAPALNSETYEKDLVLEKNVPPTHVYVIKADSERINQYWNQMRTDHPGGVDSDLREMSDLRWFAPGRYGEQVAAQENDFNCASAVFFALKCGGVDTYWLESRVRLLSGVSSLLNDSIDVFQVSNVSMKKNIKELAGYSGLMSIVQPNNINGWLQHNIGQYYESIVEGAIQKNILVVLPDLPNKKTVVKQIVDVLEPKNDQRIIPWDCAGTSKVNGGVRTLKLKEEIINKIQNDSTCVIS